MCGIAGLYIRESVPSGKILDMLFSKTEERGTDGFGLVIVKRSTGKEFKVFKSVKPYSECHLDVRDFINEVKIEIGDLILAISRAAPETESETTEDNMQPIMNGSLALVHNGAISNKIYKQIRHEAEQKYGANYYSTEIDSEAIIHSYILAERNIKDAMERISGGVAAMMYDQTKDCLYIINDFKPIAHCYIRGVGYFLSSDNDSLGEIVEEYTNCNRDGICVWENWYHHYLSGGRIKQVDLDSGFTQNIKYSPRFITQTWDSNNPKEVEHDDNSLCMVSTSGGMDSSLTLSILAMSGFKNIVACHFKYGHRGQDSELVAITDVVNKLNEKGYHVTLKVFDMEGLFTSIDTSSMLIDPNAKVTTGTAEGLKKLDAWVPGRNMFFITTMAAYAEALVMEHDYDKVHLLGGFLNLTESGHYPDNSEYFLSSALDHFKYATLIGHRIKPMFCLSNLMKSDQFALIDAFDLRDVYSHTISCDRPSIVDGIPRNCSKDGMPACGSGLLSYWASKMVGLDDMKIRNFYEVDDKEYQAHLPGHLSSETVLEKDIPSIINRILIPKENKNRLHDLYIEIQKGKQNE
jgi:7-cyano-7-deazaguanine synthase in queuosine biosynthesis